MALFIDQKTTKPVDNFVKKVFFDQKPLKIT